MKEGFLRKKTNSMMKDWKRRWFFIQARRTRPPTMALVSGVLGNDMACREGNSSMLVQITWQIHRPSMSAICSFLQVSLYVIFVCVCVSLPIYLFVLWCVYGVRCALCCRDVKLRVQYGRTVRKTCASHSK